MDAYGSIFLFVFSEQIQLEVQKFEDLVRPNPNQNWSPNKVFLVFTSRIGLQTNHVKPAWIRWFLQAAVAACQLRNQSGQLVYY